MAGGLLEMYNVIEILGKEKRGDLWLVYVLLNDGTEASGFGLEVGDSVSVWFDDRINKTRAKKH